VIGLPYDKLSAEIFRLGPARVSDISRPLWPQMIIPLRGYGVISFASAYREVRIGMIWDEWQQLLLRTYEVTFRSGEGEPLRV
jgi:hypothetical protein